MNTIRTAGLIIALATAVSCATTMPPKELVDARVSYAQASSGPAAQLNPADLHSAKTSLDLAEKSFSKDSDTQRTRDLAYVADRNAKLAESHAVAIQERQKQQQTVANMHAEETSQLQSTSAQLGRAKQTIALQGQALVTERQNRDQADQRAKQAAEDLAKFASVKQEARGMVITLSGGVLFESAKSNLIPTAQIKLNNVAEALVKQDPDSKIVVEGYTDSQGSESNNQALSERRAQSVRDYLISRGIAADRITSQGFGQTRSIADNTSPEGRANNRRVEIVVQPGK